MTVKSEKKTFRVHKVVLMKWPFFTSIFLKGGDKAEHTSFMPVSTFGKLVEYFYISSAIYDNIDIQDAVWILQFSDYYLLQEEPLKTFCESVLENGINGENWFNMFMLGVKLENDDLQNAARKMIPEGEMKEKFLEIIKKDFQESMMERDAKRRKY